MSKRIFAWFIAVLCALSASATTVNTSLYIVADSLVAVDGEKLPYKTFNLDSEFSQGNPVVELQVGDSLDLWIHNLDSVTHEFTISNSVDVASVAAGDSVFVQQVFEDAGVFIYYDPLNDPDNSVMGLAGIIVVRDDVHDGFYWNIKEHDASLNSEIMMGSQFDQSTYDPDYFTINGNSNPDVNMDETARIVGQVGDTLNLFIANTGRSIHSIHFHGYHATIEFSSRNADHVGREKDTFPIYPMETLVLQFVPDKPGEYPIHDHNLVAITANNVYPNGMFSTILISP